MSDRQVDNRSRVRLPLAGLGGVLLAAAAQCALGAGWPPCNAPGLAPPGVVLREAPPYPESARLAGAEGYVEVAFTVLRDGRVGWYRLLRAEPSGFFESAARLGVLDWRFEPARLDGVPVECRIQTRVRFTLADTVPARANGAAPGPGGHAPPRYPDALRIAGMEGYVEVEFDVAGDGRVIAPAVTLAMPRGEFEAAALAAVRAWRFPAGAPLTGQHRRFDFSLPDSLPGPPAATFMAAAPLPVEACTRRIGGRVTLEVDTDDTGRVTAARLLSSTPRGLFDDTALAIARGSRLAPARVAGQPVAATALLTLRFEPGDARCPGVDPGESRPPVRGAPAPRVSALRPDEPRAR